jgi:hypothetical protein
VPSIHALYFRSIRNQRHNSRPILSIVLLERTQQTSVFVGGPLSSRTRTRTELQALASSTATAHATYRRWYYWCWGARPNAIDPIRFSLKTSAAMASHSAVHLFDRFKQASSSAAIYPCVGPCDTAAFGSKTERHLEKH